MKWLSSKTLSSAAGAAHPVSLIIWNSLADTVYLKASPEVLAMHLRMGKGKRPLLEGKSPEDLENYVAEMLVTREPFYSKAKYTLDVSLLDNFAKIQESVQLIRELLKV